MGQCLPGMKCYETITYKTYPKGCITTESSPFSLPLSSDNIYYAGANLPYTGIQNETDLTEALQKIDQLLSGVIPNILTASATLNFPSVSAGSCEDLTISVPGAEIGDPVIVSVPEFPPLTFFNAQVTSSDTVTVRFCNNQFGITRNLDSGVFKVIVFK